MPYPSTGPKMFCAGPNFLSHSKNLIAFSASSKTFVPAQKIIFLNGNHLLVWHKMFGTGTKPFGWHKTSKSVEGQGMCYAATFVTSLSYYIYCK